MTQLNTSKTASTPDRQQLALQKEVVALRKKLILNQMQLDENQVAMAALINENQTLKQQLLTYKKHYRQLQIKASSYIDRFADMVEKTKSALAMVKNYKASIQNMTKRHRLLESRQANEHAVLNSLVKLSVKQQLALAELNKNGAVNNTRLRSDISSNASFETDDSQKAQLKHLLKTVPSLPLSKIAEQFRYTLQSRKRSKRNKRLSSNTESLLWVKLNKCTPLTNGMYYVSDGVETEIAMYSKNEQSFRRTSSNRAIEYWCYNSNSVDLTPLANPII